MTAHSDQASIDQLCRDMYRDTRKFWERIEFIPPFAFKILNGPPIRNAKILFVGYQPGGGKQAAAEELAKGTDKGWPTVCEYAIQPPLWPLARPMQYVFGVERLRQCVGTNAIFLRYPDQEYYLRHIGKKRKEIEKFCMEKVARIVEAIEPKQIVTIGFAALEMFGPSKIELRREGGTRVLTKIGTVASRPAVGVIHLAGARPSRSDLDQLKDRFKASGLIDQLGLRRAARSVKSN